MSDPIVPTQPTPDDATLLNNAILFCQDSAAKLEAARKLINPLSIDPTFRHITDSIGQLQNSMLDVLNWANRVNERLGESSTT